MRELWRRLGWLFGRRRFESELAEEMRFHLESRAEELELSGISRAQSLAQARREFGSRIKAAEDTSFAWQIRWLEDLFSDSRHAARAFRRNPGFAFTAVFCLGLGIGANLTIFNVATSFLFSRPSCRDSSSLIAIWEGGNSASTLSDYKFLRDSRIFNGMAGINVEREANWREGDRTSRFYAGVVTDDYFANLDVPMFLGRGIAPGEKDTAVLSYRVWSGKFGSDSAILGRKIVLDGRLYTVCGVLPDNNRSIVGFGISPEVYIPILRDDDYVQLYARMQPGMTIPIARARLRSVLGQLDKIRPDPLVNRVKNTRVTGVVGFDILNEQMPGVITAFFAMLMIAVGLVLLIACTNVASLLLARASSRSQEIAIRLSLGAGRGRIMRHLLAESLLLAVLGCCAGLAIDSLCSRLIGNIPLPIPIPLHLVVTPDWRLLWYSLAIALASGLLCGLLPAAKAVRRDVNNVLKQGERQTARTWNLRSVLVAGQIAVSLVLLATAFLFIHNLMRATSMNPGFDVRHTVWSYMRLAPDKYGDLQQKKQKALVHSALEQLRALPGVESAAITRIVPFNGNWHEATAIQTDLSTSPTRVRYAANESGPDYFRTIGIPILRGREFSPADETTSRAVAIVNESFARQVFGTVDPIGHTFRQVLPDEGKTMLIVAVAKDSKYWTMGEEQQLAIYQPYFANNEPVNLQFLARVAGSPGAYVKPINELLGRMDPSAAIETKPMSQALGLALLPSQAGAVMLGTLGALGLVLAAIGLYGVLLYAVSRRTREIGVRMALGATPADVLRMVGRDSALLVGCGSAAGLALAILAVRPLTLFLVPGLKTVDPTAFAGVVFVLAVVAMLATLAPVKRALRVDPMSALRYE